MLLQKHFGKLSVAGLLLGLTVVSLILPQGLELAVIGDTVALVLLCLVSGVMLANAFSSRGQTRTFWALMAAGCLAWTINQGAWTYYEVILRRDLPDPFFGDVVLFLHIVPLMAAVALRPHQPQEQKKLYFSTLNFLMLLLWWVFLYAFVVFPDEYVRTNTAVYSHRFDVLYLLEKLILLGAVALLAAKTRGSWRRIYWNLFLALGLYTLSSEAMNAAIAQKTYYSGSLYDVPFSASLCWLIWVGLLARKTQPACDPEPAQNDRLIVLAPRLAMGAILSLPIMGFWAMFYDSSAPQLREFRLMATLAALLVLGVCVFIRQYLLDWELMRLLDESQHSFENLQRLQSQLVQKEKLASLGQLVAGAAHEINNPLAAILGYSDLLSSSGALNEEQSRMAQKIGQQARRTRDLVAGLLSFAQRTPAEKGPVELGSLLQRAAHVEAPRFESKGIQVETRVAPGLPPVWGNANQLFQCCLRIFDNAMDALEETSGES